MKKFFKFLTLVLVVATVATVSALSLVGCGGEKETFVANIMEGADAEDYAFCVKEGNTALKDQINEFFAKDTTKAAVNTSLAYHTGASETTITYPDLSDNTGDTITMITEAGFAPYEYTKTAGAGVINQVAGVDVDMMMLFCEAYGYKMDLKDVEFKTIPNEVNKSDKYIGAAGMTISEEREKVIDFAAPYIKTKQYIISSSTNNFKKMDDLKGLKIGVQDSTTGNFMVEDAIAEANAEEGIEAGVLAGSGAECQAFDKVIVAFDALTKGKIDAIVIDEFVAKGLVANYNA